MSIQAVAWALEQDIPSAGMKLVLISLCNHANHKTGECWPSIATVEREASMTRRTVQRNIALLIDAGFIEARADFAESGRQGANVYRIISDPVERGALTANHKMLGVGCHSDIPSRDDENASDGALEGVTDGAGEGATGGAPINHQKEPSEEPPPPITEAAPVTKWEGDFSIFWDEWPILLRPDNRHHCAGIFRNLSEEARAAAIAQAGTYRKLMACRKKPPRLVTYLSERIFAELDGGPQFDTDGDFLITPDRPEWSSWLGSIRSRFGESGVQSIVRKEKPLYRTKTRWPDPKTQAAA
ncbi:helix-turn-helix domain-containing protein [Mesorhizobium sp. M0028]|uniref:helix-turn-helix domain-containing protein n=1 Tax=Mesorhizobium sp. M0028 TaxID=2956849 RepID=UPI0033396B7F